MPDAETDGSGRRPGGDALSRLVASASCRLNVKSSIGFLTGGFQGAVAAFEALGPADVRSIPTRWGDAVHGRLPDGIGVVARPGSNMGQPTLQIDLPPGNHPKRIVIRFTEGDPAGTRTAWNEEVALRRARRKARTTSRKAALRRRRQA